MKFCSPFVLMTAAALFVRESHIRTVLSPLAVAKWSGLFGCQQSWSTLSPCPRNMCSLLWIRQKTGIKWENKGTQITDLDLRYNTLAVAVQSPTTHFFCPLLWEVIVKFIFISFYLCSSHCKQTGRCILVTHTQ